MKDPLFCLVGNSAALGYAAKHLCQRGIRITSTPSPDVTHLLLPIPSLDENGYIKGGIKPDQLLSQIPKDTVIFGGNLQPEAFYGFKCIDLLKDYHYLSQNAAITAYCAYLRIGNALPVTLSRCPILIIGWGRIGKCLGALLKAVNADVTVAARKESDRATLESLGYTTADPAQWASLDKYRAIINTAPMPVLTDTSTCREDCVFLDLASKPGILAERVLWERGLPNRDAPESSGILIAETILRFLKNGE